MNEVFKSYLNSDIKSFLRKNTATENYMGAPMLGVAPHELPRQAVWETVEQNCLWDSPVCDVGKLITNHSYFSSLSLPIWQHPSCFCGLSINPEPIPESFAERIAW